MNTKFPFYGLTLGPAPREIPEVIKKISTKRLMKTLTWVAFVLPLILGVWWIYADDVFSQARANDNKPVRGFVLKLEMEDKYVYVLMRIFTDENKEVEAWTKQPEDIEAHFWYGREFQQVWYDPYNPQRIYLRKVKDISWAYFVGLAGILGVFTIIVGVSFSAYNSTTRIAKTGVILKAKRVEDRELIADGSVIVSYEYDGKKIETKIALPKEAVPMFEKNAELKVLVDIEELETAIVI